MLGKRVVSRETESRWMDRLIRSSHEVLVSCEEREERWIDGHFRKETEKERSRNECKWGWIRR